LAKPELGTKRLCPACGTKYYDLNRNPITCPHCGTIFELAAGAKAMPPERAVAPEPDEVEDTAATAEGDAEIVSLEEVEATEADGDTPADDDEAVIPEEETLEIETEVEPEDAETFLDPEAEEGDDDVTDLLDVDGEEEDEV
jgi:uncharacterized protein (TIGR02300 family)